MYKVHSEPPAGNYVTEISEVTLCEVEVIVTDNRKNNKETENFVFFVTLDVEPIQHKIDRICKELGYNRYGIGEVKYVTYQYDVSRKFLELFGK